MKTILISIMFLLGLSNNVWAETKVLNFAYENKQDYPNYLGDSDAIDWAKPGVAIEGVMLLEKKLKVKVNLTRIPWKRILEEELKNGRLDGAFLGSYKKEREVFGAYPKKNGKLDDSRRFMTKTYSFFKLKTSNVEWDGKKLKNLNGAIGAPSGYSIVGDLKDMGYTNIDEAGGAKTNLQKLSLGRVGVVALLETQGDYVLEKFPDLASQIEKMPTPILSKPYFLILSNQFVEKDPKMADKIWNAIKDIREKDYQKIENKYAE